MVSSNTPASAEQGPYDVQNGSSPMPGGSAANGTATTGLAGHRGGAGRTGGFVSRVSDNVVSVTLLCFGLSAARDTIMWRCFW